MSESHEMRKILWLFALAPTACYVIFD